MYQLHVDRWYDLGRHLRLTNDQLEEAKKNPNPTAAVLLAAKVKNINLKWSDIVEALLRVGEYEVAQRIANEHSELYHGVQCMCLSKDGSNLR